MSTRPRMVATDLDGTFLSPDGTVSAENAEAVAAAIDAGITVVFATGRPPRWLDVVAELPVAHPIVVASNGALLWDLGDNRPLASWTIDPGLAADITTDLRAALPQVAFGVERGLRFGLEPGYHIGWQPPEQETVDRAAGELPPDPRFFCGELPELLAEPFVKLLVQHPSIRSDELAVRVGEVVGDAVTITHSAYSELPGLLEVSAPGVTKAHALAVYAEQLGIAPAEVAAFGDMPNDLAMLEWAGMPHVMANAHTSLLELGATTIGSNAESAVGRTIQAWL